MKSKKKVLKEHTYKRFYERFGINYTNGLRSSLIGMIRNGKTQIVEKKSNNRTLHRILYKGRSIVVVYDKKRTEIVTVLYDFDEVKVLKDVEQKEKEKKERPLSGEKCIERYQNEKKQFAKMPYSEWKNHLETIK